MAVKNKSKIKLMIQILLFALVAMAGYKIIYKNMEYIEHHHYKDFDVMSNDDIRLLGVLSAGDKIKAWGYIKEIRSFDFKYKYNPRLFSLSDDFGKAVRSYNEALNFHQIFTHWDNNQLASKFNDFKNAFASIAKGNSKIYPSLNHSLQCYSSAAPSKIKPSFYKMKNLNFDKMFLMISQESLVKTLSQISSFLKVYSTLVDDYIALHLYLFRLSKLVATYSTLLKIELHDTKNTSQVGNEHKKDQKNYLFVDVSTISLQIEELSNQISAQVDKILNTNKIREVLYPDVFLFF